MTSEASQANRRHYEAAATRGAQRTPQDTIDWNEVHWATLTKEPQDVDYLEVRASGAPAMWLVPHGGAQDRVLLYVHGGGFVAGSIYTHRKMIAHIAKAVGCRALTFDYPYAHEQKYPAQLDTTVGVYRWLLDQKIKPECIAMACDSCGAILTVGLLQRARQQGLPLPAGLVFLSGWLDAEQTGQSYETNRAKDPFFVKQGVDFLSAHFRGDQTDVGDPLANPLKADLKGFPPILLQAGADEALVDDSRMFAARAKAAGVS